MVVDTVRGAGEVGPFALFPLRVGLALVFLFTGLEKLLDIEGNAAITALTGMPWPYALTIVAGVVEALGGLALLLGVFTRSAATGLSLLMLVILISLKIPGPFWGDGWGIDVAVLAGTLTLVLNGPGRPTLLSVLGTRPLDPETMLWRRWVTARRSGPVAGAPGRAEPARAADTATRRV